MSAKELFYKLKPLWENYKPDFGSSYFSGISQGALSDIKNKEEVGYYQMLPVIVEYLKPRVALELGGAMGASTLMMLSSLPRESYLYSITLPEEGLEFSFVKEKYPNFVPIVGNDLNLTIWPKSLDLAQTDLWFFDTTHSYQQLSQEYQTYKPYFKKGAVILLDDIKLNEGMFKAWTEWEGDKFDASTWLHHSGFGIIT